MGTSSSPALLELGRMIKEVRERQGLTQTELANRIGKAQGTVQKAEKGRVRTQSATLELLIGVLGFDQAGADRLRELHREGSSIQSWSGERALVPQYARRFLADEQYAREVLCWHEMRVPGVLQSTQFALHQFGAAGVTDVSPYYRNREDRKKIFTRPGLERYACILAEEVFTVGVHRWGEHVVSDEIDYLLELEDSRVDLRILPTRTELVYQPGDFCVLRMPDDRNSYVYIEDVCDADYREKPDDIDKAVAAWQKLAAKTLDQEQTRLRLSQLRQEIRRWVT